MNSNILFTGDIQAEFHNLDLCEEMWKEILSISKKNKVKYIGVLGDLTQEMNPKDVRVIKWWQHAINKALKQGFELILMLGNHDRVGHYSNADNWLSILKKKHVHVFTKPGTFATPNYDLTILPYASLPQTRKDAIQCKENISKKPNILLFHQDIKGAWYNQQGSKSHEKLTEDDLFCSRYKYCIGGHLHLPQQFGKKQNIYYVGSPFCHDWGEVNQVKRYIVIREASLSSINSKIPGWYDPDVHGFTAIGIKDWRDVKLRISVSCNANEDYGRRLEKVRVAATTKYKGANIYVVPRFKEQSRNETTQFRYDDSDKRKLKAYSKTKNKYKVNTIEYMLEKLSYCSSGLRQSSQIKFLKAKGINFGSFKKVELDLTRKGIILIRGINEDRNNKSNGSGKTTLINLLPVCWFGRTFKDQTHDKWANRWVPKEPATVEVTTRDERHHKIKVIRGRRPPLLKMFIDGVDKSSGMKTTSKDGTQLQIEKYTGFTFQTLANAIYIDRSIADAFLSGTKKQRTELLSRFLNLERFAFAHKLVLIDRKILFKNTVKVTEKLAYKRGLIKELEESITNIRKVERRQIDIAYAQLTKAKKNKELFIKLRSHASVKFAKKLGSLNTKINKLTIKRRKIEVKADYARQSFEEETTKTDKLNKLLRKKQCPTCLQPVTKGWIKKHRHVTQDEFDSKHKAWDKYNNKAKSLRDKIAKLELDAEDYQESLDDLSTTLDNLKQKESMCLEQYNQLKANETASVSKKEKSKLTELKHSKHKLNHKLHLYKKKDKMYKFAQEAFSRDGIPAYLNQQLCPVLNKASDYYAELFSDKEIQVQFVVEEGEFVPKIINTRGGEDIGDQSTGERALAGLIASFALREVAPKTNLLILDEPGEGLDEHTARQFAKALKSLKERFGAIYVASHNPVIVSELSGEKLITVRKHNRISRIGEE